MVCSPGLRVGHYTMQSTERQAYNRVNGQKEPKKIYSGYLFACQEGYMVGRISTKHISCRIVVVQAGFSDTERYTSLTIMANLNKVMLIGNLTADPEVRQTPRGNSLTELRLAVNRVSSGPNEGERREETTFLDVTCWGRTGEVAAQYLSKGRPVFIEGRLQMDTWEDKQTGQRRSKIRIIAENLQLLGGRDGAPQGGGNYGNNGGGYQQRSNNYGNNGGYQQQGGNNYNNGSYQQRSNSYGNGGGYQQPSAPAPAPMPEETDDIPF